MIDFQAMYERWDLDDAARAEMPMTEDYCETFPVGMAIDYTSQHPIPVGELVWKD